MAASWRLIDVDMEETSSLIINASVRGRIDYPEGTNTKGPAQALGESVCPQIGDGFLFQGDNLPAVFCFNRKIKKSLEFPHIFNVQLQYTNDTHVDAGFDPISFRTRYSYGFAKFQKPIERDTGNNQIKNSAGDAFLDTPQIDDSRPLVRVVRYETTYPEQTAIDYQDAVNSSPVKVNGVWFPVDSLKMSNITGDEEIHNGVVYFLVTYEIEIRRDLWILKLLDKGFRYISGGALKQARDPSGALVSHEVLLDGSGGKLAFGGTPTYLTWDVYKSKDFNLLGL